MRDTRFTTRGTTLTAALAAGVFVFASVPPLVPSAHGQVTQFCGVEVQGTLQPDSAKTFTSFVKRAVTEHLTVGCEVSGSVSVQLVAAAFTDGQASENQIVSDPFSVGSSSVALGSDRTGNFGSAVLDQLDDWFGGAELSPGEITTREIQLPGGVVDDMTRRLAVKVASSLAPETGVVLLVLPAKGTDQGRISVGLATLPAS